MVLASRVIRPTDPSGVFSSEIVVTISRVSVLLVLQWPLVSLQFRSLDGLERWVGLNLVWADTALKDAIYSMVAEMRTNGMDRHTRQLPTIGSVPSLLDDTEMEPNSLGGDTHPGDWMVCGREGVSNP